MCKYVKDCEIEKGIDIMDEVCKDKKICWMHTLQLARELIGSVEEHLGSEKKVEIEKGDFDK